MSLANLVSGVIRKPMKIVVYGVPGVGKTTFAAAAPGAIFADVEQGSSNLDVVRFPNVGDWSALMDCFTQLYQEQHDYKTLVIDSATAVQDLARQHVLAVNDWGSIEEPGYGKGYVAVRETFDKLLQASDALIMKGMNIVIVAHAQVSKFQDPTGEDYDHYSLDLDKRLAPGLKAWADYLLFADHDKTTKEVGEGFSKRRVAKSWGNRVMYTEHRASHEAKNRAGLPERMNLNWPEFEAAVDSFYSPKEQTTNAA